jgi:putative transposase
MRSRRLLDDQGLSYYHCLSRVIEKRFIFEEKEREYFRKLIRRQEAFSGVRVLTWTCLSNHFHVLVAVEEKKGAKVQEELQHLMDNDETFRLKPLYAPSALEDMEKLLKHIRATPNPDETDADGERSRKHVEWKKKQIARVKQPFLDRMHDLSCFVGELKQRISQWYNLKTDRQGPLWEDRFKSVLVQGSPGVLATVAAYIDLKCGEGGDREGTEAMAVVWLLGGGSGTESGPRRDLRGVRGGGRCQSGWSGLAAGASALPGAADFRRCPTSR